MYRINYTDILFIYLFSLNAQLDVTKISNNKATTKLVLFSIGDCILVKGKCGTI